MTKSNQQLNLSPVEYIQSLWLKKLNCGSLYDESMLNDSFIKGLDE